MVDGHDIRDVELKSLRSQVALVSQEAFLLPMSIADNIALGRSEASRMANEIAGGLRITGAPASGRNRRVAGAADPGGVARDAAGLERRRDRPLLLA